MQEVIFIPSYCLLRRERIGEKVDEQEEEDEDEEKEEDTLRTAGRAGAGYYWKGLWQRKDMSWVGRGKGQEGQGQEMGHGVLVPPWSLHSPLVLTSYCSEDKVEVYGVVAVI